MFSLGRAFIRYEDKIIPFQNLHAYKSVLCNSIKWFILLNLDSIFQDYNTYINQYDAIQLHNWFYSSKTISDLDPSH